VCVHTVYNSHHLNVFRQNKCGHAVRPSDNKTAHGGRRHQEGHLQDRLRCAHESAGSRNGDHLWQKVITFYLFPSVFKYCIVFEASSKNPKTAKSHR